MENQEAEREAALLEAVKRNVPRENPGIPEVLKKAEKYEVVDDKNLPAFDNACIFCPAAIWFIDGSNSKAYCTKMMRDMFDSSKSSTKSHVRFCSARDDALKEKKEAVEAVAEWQKAKASTI